MWWAPHVISVLLKYFLLRYEDSFSKQTNLQLLLPFPQKNNVALLQGKKNHVLFCCRPNKLSWYFDRSIAQPCTSIYVFGYSTEIVQRSRIVSQTEKKKFLDIIRGIISFHLPSQLPYLLVTALSNNSVCFFFNSQFRDSWRTTPRESCKTPHPPLKKKNRYSSVMWNFRK